MRKYKADVKLPNGSTQQIVIDANSPANAKAMLEAQYGKGSVRTGPVEVR